MKSAFLSTCLRRLVVGLAVIYIVAFSSLTAQVPASGEKIKFCTFGWKVTPDDLYYESEGKVIKLVVYSSSRSTPQDYPKAATIAFFRWVSGPEGKLVREEAATVNLGAAGPRPLLVFMATPESPKRYRVAAIADDTKAFPVPSYRFINLTAVEIYIKCGGQTLKLPAQNAGMLDSQLKKVDTPETIQTMIYVVVEDGPLRVYASNRVVRPNERSMVFVFPEDNRLKVMFIADDGT